jgi:hypothetical protein
MQPISTIVELTPQAIADAVDHFVTLMESDQEVASVLTKCREGLRAISWNRYAALQTRRSRARVLRRRHQRRQSEAYHA